LYIEALLSIQKLEIPFSLLKHNSDNIYFLTLPWGGVQYFIMNQTNAKQLFKISTPILERSSITQHHSQEIFQYFIMGLILFEDAY